MWSFLTDRFFHAERPDAFLGLSGGLQSLYEGCASTRDGPLSTGVTGDLMVINGDLMVINGD